VVVRV